MLLRLLGCVYNTEHVGGFRRLICVNHNEEQTLPLLTHEHSLGLLAGA